MEGGGGVATLSKHHMVENTGTAFFSDKDYDGDDE